MLFSLLLLSSSFTFPFPLLVWFSSLSGAKKPYCVTLFSLKWLKISLGSVSKNQLQSSPKILETPNPCTSLSFCNVEIWLQRYVASTTLRKAGGWWGGRGEEATFSKVFQGFCVGFKMLNAVNFLFQLIFIFSLFLGMVVYANEFKTEEIQKLTEIKKIIAT